jgi:hypothetical protein
MFSFTGKGKTMAESAPIPVLLELMFIKSGAVFAERRLPLKIRKLPAASLEHLRI